MIQRIRKGNDFKHVWAISWNGLPEDFSDATDITLTATVYGEVKTLTEGVDYHIDGGNVVVDFTPAICDITGTYNLELNYVKPNNTFIDGDKRSAVDINAFQIVASSDDADTTGDTSSTSDAAIGLQGKSAYHLWLDDGNVGTEDDYFAYLRQPATDAAEAANSAAGLANNAATTANTAAGLADTARLAIQDDLASKADQTELDQLAGDVSLFKEESNLKDAVQGAKIKDIESVISTMNPNQSAQLSVSGVSPLSLPKNAANGGMSVKLEGLTAENEAVNGNFENGLRAPFSRDNGTSEGTSTLAINSSTPISGNYDIRFTITTPSTTEWYPILFGLDGAANIGDKIYFHFYAKILSGIPKITSIHNGGSSGIIYSGDVINGRNTRIIDVVGTSVNAGLIYFSSTSVWDMQMDNFMRINLTKTFGAGNEPTVEECDLMFSDYFEGVKSFEPTGRVRSVDKNGLNPTHLYLTAPELRSNGTVKDEIRKGANGYELVKRVNEIVISGVENFINFGQITLAAEVYRANINNWASINNALIQDNAGIGKNDLHVFEYKTGGGATTTSFAFYFPLGHLYLAIDKAYLDANYAGTIEGFKQYLQEHPIKLTYTLAEPEITPISYGGILNSSENGTVYHEPIIADAGVYDTKMDILLTDYPIATIEEIIKHENGVDTYLNVASAVITGDGLSFTHPDLADGDLVLFTYAYDKESTNGNITATFYDSNVVKIDTVTGKAYRINEVVTNGVLTRTLTEV